LKRPADEKAGGGFERSKSAASALPLEFADAFRGGGNRGSGCFGLRDRSVHTAAQKRGDSDIGRNVEDSESAKWEGTPPVQGQALAPGSQLSAPLRVGGPSSFPMAWMLSWKVQRVQRWETPNRLSIESGRLTATVPESAHGFTVGTPTGDVVDLGTEFGVDVSAIQVVNVTVFPRGHVKMAPSKSAENSLTLAAGGVRSAQTARGGSRSHRQQSRLHARYAPYPRAAGGAWHRRGIESGNADPYWTVQKQGMAEPSAPTKGVVFDVQAVHSNFKEHIAGTPAGQWISRTEDEGEPVAKSGCSPSPPRSISRAVDPATANLTIRCAAERLRRFHPAERQAGQHEISIPGETMPSHR